jgi:cytochrome c5
MAEKEATVTKTLIRTLAMMGAVSAMAWAGAAPKPHDQPKKPTANSAQTATTGDDVFQANCFRCHAPPMSISPRTTGTVIMHMRARARLSREDEVKLLRFMAP